MVLAVFLYDRRPSFLYTLSTRWDSQVFESIATQGYARGGFFYAYSPFYPALIKGLSFILPDAWICALIVTNILSFAFPLILMKTFGYKTALITVLFPTYLVFTTIPYSDVLSLLFLALSILLIMRERIIASSAAVSLAICNSFNLAWTLPSYLLVLLRGKRMRNLLFCVLPIATGVLILFWFKLKTGSYWTFFSVEHDVWMVCFATPLTQARWLLNVGGHGWLTSQHWKIHGITLKPRYWLVRNLAFEAFYMSGAIILFRTAVKHRVFLGIYCLMVIVPLLFTIGTPAVSIPRLLLPAFPVFVGYSQLLRRQRYSWGYYVACVIAAAGIVLIQTFSFFS